VAGSLDGRVKRLENGRVKPCEECGFDGDWSNGYIVIEWYDGEQDTGPENTTYCETCGEPTAIVVTWDGIPPSEAEDIREEI
jgi:hypothetical protein